MPTDPTNRVAEGEPFDLEILNPTGLDKPAFLMNVSTVIYQGNLPGLLSCRESRTGEGLRKESELVPLEKNSASRPASPDATLSGIWATRSGVMPRSWIDRPDGV